MFLRTGSKIWVENPRTQRASLIGEALMIANDASEAELRTLFEFCEHLFGEGLEGIEDAHAVWSDGFVLGHAGGV